MRRLALLLALLLALAPFPARAEDPPKEEEPADEASAPEGIAWVRDLEEGRQKAADAGKGLFVYMTPNWFECGFCKRLQADGYSDPEIQKYVNDHFVAVWIEDSQEDPVAAKLGLRPEGYPNIAVYDAAKEHLGRIVGFGGRDPWFEDLERVVGVGEAIAAAKAKADADPAQWVGVAEIVLGIPDRAKDAAALLEKVPAKARASNEYKALAGRIAARAAWAETDAALDQIMEGVRTLDAAKEKAPAAVEELDKFLEAHAGQDDVVEPTALARKGFFLFILGKEGEATEVAKRLLDAFPESDQAKQLLRGLR